MADVFSKKKRSQVMAAIRSIGNKDTELRLAKFFRQHGITGWRRHQPLIGKPDFIFRRQKLAVFVDGCFWHGCPKHCRTPAAKKGYWKNKIEGNKKRDLNVARLLRRQGWRVVRLWEHDLQKENKVLSRFYYLK